MQSRFAQLCRYPGTSKIVSKISGDQIVRASAAADVHLGSGGTYQVTIGIERVQKTRLIVTSDWLNSLERIFVYEKRCLNGAVVSPKSHGAPRAVIRTTMIWKLNHVVGADQLSVYEFRDGCARFASWHIRWPWAVPRRTRVQSVDPLSRCAVAKPGAKSRMLEQSGRANLQVATLEADYNPARS